MIFLVKNLSHDNFPKTTLSFVKLKIFNFKSEKSDKLISNIN